MTSAGSRARILSAVLLIAVTLSFLFTLAASRFSTPRQMLLRHDWVVPHVNGISYLEKPPLYFWFTAAAMSLFGSADWVVVSGPRPLASVRSDTEPLLTDDEGESSLRLSRSAFTRLRWMS